MDEKNIMLKMIKGRMKKKSENESNKKEVEATNKNIETEETNTNSETPMSMEEARNKIEQETMNKSTNGVEESESEEECPIKLVVDGQELTDIKEIIKYIDDNRDQLLSESNVDAD